MNDVDLGSIPGHEALVAVPRGLIYGDPLAVPDMIAWLTERHTFDLFRWEGRGSYNSTSDADDVARYHRGEAQPTSEGRDSWHARLRGDIAAGRSWRKVHGVRGALTDYEQYEFGWGFTGTVSAGEQVRVLEIGSDQRAVSDLPDFFVLDGEHVLVSIYDEDGRLTGGLPVYGPHAVAYRALAETIWPAAVDFTAWGDAHPQYHRNGRAA